MQCIYCKHPIGENTRICENCGAKLSLPAKWRGQHVRKKDILSVDTLSALIAAVLMIVALFLPVCGFRGGAETRKYTLWQGLSGMCSTDARWEVGIWPLILILVFTVIFISAWFLGEKSSHYFWAAASGTIGSWLMCIVCTFFMAQVCAYFGYESLYLTAGYFLWVTALVLQAVSLILYRWRTRILKREEAEKHGRK